MAGRLPITLTIAAEVHAVSVDGDVVFLSVLQDAYACVPQAVGAMALSEDRRSLAVEDPDLATELIQAGVVLATPDRRSADTNTAADSLLAPVATALVDGYAFPRGGDALDATVALLDLLFAYRGRRFADILKAARRPRTAPPRLTPELMAAVDAFHRWAPFAPTSAKCLLRSFMLLRLLHRRQQDALWVFGVRTWPFQAHCWLQCEDTVLDDQPDRIRAFTPILIV